MKKKQEKQGVPIATFLLQFRDGDSNMPSRMMLLFLTHHPFGAVLSVTSDKCKVFYSISVDCPPSSVFVDSLM